MKKKEKKTSKWLRYTIRLSFSLSNYLFIFNMMSPFSLPTEEITINEIEFENV